MNDKPNIASDLTRLNWFIIQRALIDYAESVGDNSVYADVRKTQDRIDAIIKMLGPAREKLLWVLVGKEPNSDNSTAVVFNYSPTAGIGGVEGRYRTKSTENVVDAIADYFPNWILTEHEEYPGGTYLMRLEERSS